MKKILCIIAAIVLTISMAACSDSSSTAETSSGSSSSSSSDSESKGGKDAPPDKPDGEKPDGKPDGKPGGGPGGGPGGSKSEVVYDAASEITEAQRDDNKSYESSDADKIALMINTSDEVTITDPTVKKSGDSDGGDNCNFYGQNAAVLVKGGSTTTISGGTVTSDASGANGVFCYGGNGGKNGSDGDGTTLVIKNTTITTTGDGSG